MKRLPALRTSHRNFCVRTSRYADTFIDIYQVVSDF